MAGATDDVEGKKVRWSDGGGFAVMPEWLLNARVSDRAIRLYLILGRHADRELQAVVTRRQLAAKLSVSASTLDVALKELRDAGALTVTGKRTKAGDKGPNEYRLHVAPTSREGCTDVPVDGCTGISGIKEREDFLEREREGAKAPSQALVPSARSVPEHPPAIKLDGKENVPLNTLMAECGVDPGNKQRVAYALSALNGSRGHQGIVDLFWLEAVRWAEEHDQIDRVHAMYEDRKQYTRALTNRITHKAALYRKEMHGARLTPSALRNWWLDVEVKQQKTRRGMTRDDILNL